MSEIKKVIVAVLCLVMVFSVVPLTSMARNFPFNDQSSSEYCSDNEETDSDAYCDEVFTIHFGERINVRVNSYKITYIKFVPQFSDWYTFTSISGRDTYGYLYDAYGNQLTHDDDSGIGLNFKITSYLTAGNTYYYGVRFYSHSSSGSFDVKLTYPSYEEDSSEYFEPTTAPVEYSSEYFEPTTYYEDVIDIPSSNITIGVGDTINVHVDSNRITFIKFIPQTSGYYTFTSISGGDTYGYLYDEFGNMMDSNDDSGYNYNFKISSYLFAGNTYYYGVRFYYRPDSGSFDVRLDDYYYEEDSSEYFEPTTYYEDVIDIPSSNITIGVDETINVHVDSNRITFIKFIPQTSGYYTFTSISGGDTYGYLYDEFGNMMDSNDDSGYNYNFKMSSYLFAGNTYYYGVRFYNRSESGSFDVRLTAGIEEESSYYEEPTTREPQVYLLGDVNFDGKITVVDARRILRMAVRLDPMISIVPVADINGDGSITVVDARLTLLMALGIDNSVQTSEIWC